MTRVKSAEIRPHPADGEGVRGQPEVRLSLTATGGEPQQICHRLGPRGALRMCRIAQRGQVQQQERELERAPGPVMRLVFVKENLAGITGFVTAPGRSDPCVNALQMHRAVREPERGQGIRVPEHQLDPRLDPVSRPFRVNQCFHGLVRVLVEVLAILSDPRLRPPDPRPISGNQRQEPRPQILRLALG